MGFFDLINGGVGQMVGGALQGAINMGSTAMSNRQNYKYNTKLMSLQNQYNIDAWNRSVARDDYLLSNSQKLQKDALRSAGYSTADPNGTGVMNGGSTLQPQAYPSASFNAQPYSFDIIGPMAALAQLKKTNAEKEGQDLSNQFSRETMKDREKAVSLNNDLIQKNIQQIDSTIQNINQDSELKREQKREVTQSILNLEGQLETIKINNKWLDKINEKSLAKLEKEVDNIQAMTSKTRSEKLFQDYVNCFAQFGMFIGNDFLTNLQFISTSKHADKLVKDFGSTLKQAFQEGLNETSGVSDYVKNKVVSLWDRFCSKFGF